MAWRGIHISNPARLSFRQHALVIEQDEEDAAHFPLEDIAWIVFDTQQITLTAKLLAACMETGIPLICSDARHMPCGVALPFHQHFRQAEIAQKQIAVSAALKKRLWKEIIRSKIINQASVLSRIGQREQAETLKKISLHVKSGDPKNIEARAARFYSGIARRR